MILENLAHLLSKDNSKKQQEIGATIPIDADRMRVTRNKFAKLSREKKLY